MNPLTHKIFRVAFCPFLSVLTGIALAGGLPLNAEAATQSSDISAMRDLRIACLESINNARARLDELHGFVAQQGTRERSASDRLFELQHNAIAAKRRNADLQIEVGRATNRLARAQTSVDQATASYRAAAAEMPSGEDWARDGSTALSELRRAADAAPQEVWKYKRYKEAQAEFVQTLAAWRAVRRSMEQASFDLDMRASGSAFERTSAQIASSLSELKVLERQLNERQTALEKLSKKSEEWGAAVQSLRDEEAHSRDQLAAIRFKFHLVDLKFAAWRLKGPDLANESDEMLPDALERALENEDVLRDSGSTSLARSGINPMQAGLGLTDASGVAGEQASQDEAVEKGDPAFRNLLARVLLAQGRLRFLSNVLERECNAVQSAIAMLERGEEQVRTLAESTGRLAADQESLRRSQEAEELTLAKGTETLDLVKKRFAADHKAIAELLSTASERTAALAKKLEK